MTRQIRILPLVVASTLGLALAACSTSPNVGPSTSSTISTDEHEIEVIAQLLDQGELRDARKRLDDALRRDPMNASLLVLHQGMIGDAKADLGPTSYPYTVTEGETMAGLAQRFLGNRLKSYQLARYNGIANPAALTVGQILRIPGQAERAQSERTATPARSSNPTIADGDKQRTSPAPAASPPPRPADAAGAQRARTAGLAALNKGEVGEAVTLLQRAASLDPGNDAIERDLVRARRIAATVRSQR